MQPPRHKNAALGAKRRGEIRPHYGMPLGLPTSTTPAFGALAGLGVIWAISGCFNVNYGNCRLTCEKNEHCPSSLACVLEEGTGRGFCAQEGTTCPGPQTDAGADASAMDGGGDDGSDAMDGGDGGDGPDGETSGPPEVLCHNQRCLTLPPEVRAHLVLLLWPSNLPTVGSPVSVWPDQSGHGNHASAIYPSALPHVIPNGVQLDPNRLGSGFRVVNSPSVDFGAGDFAVLVVAGLSSGAIPVTFFRKWDGARENSRRISIEWVISPPSAGRPQGAVNDTPVATGMDTTQPSVRAYTLRRTIDHLDLHLNEAVIGSDDLPTAGASTSNARDIFIGVGDTFGAPADSLEAVIAIRGSIRSADLTDLQVFLRTVFAAP